MSLKQFLQFKLSQKLSPQQIQLMKLIQLPTQAFEQRLRQELEDNPALESEVPTPTNFPDARTLGNRKEGVRCRRGTDRLC